MKKVCIVTASRSEYGLLRWTIDAVRKDPELELQLVVTGTHLQADQGLTYKRIEEDGFPIAARVDMQLDASSKIGVVDSMGRCSSGFARTFADLSPDIVIVLGDRYELLPICSAAVVMNIPIAHIAGGEVTLGAIDDKIRNAVTMMASLHFPNGEEACRNIIRMRGSSENVLNVGEPCIENYLRLNLSDRETISSGLGLDASKDWYLVTLHPETNLTLEENVSMAENLLQVLSEVDGEVVITGANADFGGPVFNGMFVSAAKTRDNIHFFESLGQIRYLSCMKECFCVVGNSSSGVIETPFLGVPAVNIGNRQTGRRICANVRCSDSTYDGIKSAITMVTAKRRYASDGSFGDGTTSSRIVSGLKRFLNERK